ncbi:putative P-loop containing nucleoside triphosphate hydrolase [Helianthus annuus]|uniref:P-loop containing nucleoside triphosphate hydrolase n=1 Tax=Helianthus annuus TaxID=4232 RepID=A0A251SQH2_HELAN|nr:putative late blight resistance protein homolog R1A-10 [Helianthus annuus]KAF5778555.1 putative P-loop containing nucleoside triphosphate hydrolase [Helianthus annuus]KAJ0489953.1 putative P-loop containing nucleoside triphosphate hydrolase [Helianthus annuus]KAJ0493988.1 putative P-loop containing nucleoside triphosphate hydrolase [Helianthus annuus]KAJ0675538.1 putative P-loop containing nucleoside triphosphate hydrolase [Helianthus annuus]KAJ0678818.1 putative P-loop containing nucleosid
MAYTGLKLFMLKLKQMILSNNHPLVTPQFQLLYDGLGLMIQTIFVEKESDLHKLEEVRNLKRRFKDVTKEAHDMLDLFVSAINFKHKICDPISYVFDFSLIIEDVMRSIKSIREDFISILNNTKMELYPRTDSQKTRSAAAGGTSCSRNSPVWEENEIVVGLDPDIDIIRDKLSEDTKKLDVISIVGMGGSGKTTLATKVFNDRFVVYHFRVRGWVTVSQKYEKTDLLNQMLASIGVEMEHDQRDSYSHLREKLHKCLMGKRYLVVIDDIWNNKSWDDLKVVFPDNNNGSRLLVTSRHKRVALHAKSNGLIHQLRYLTDEESWELLHKKVFHGNDFPDVLTVPGMQIARNCHGLPLAVVVIAGVLAKEPVIKDTWERISRRGGSLIVKALALSLNHLPSHLRDCFLYLGSFPEDYRFGVPRLICLWIAQGFIQEVKSQSFEETAKDYLMELVDRNLVVIQDRKFNGAIKTFSLHDVLRELSMEIATKERFCTQVIGWDNCIIAPFKTSRIFIGHDTKLRSLLPFYSYSYESYIIHKCSQSWSAGSETMSSKIFPRRNIIINWLKVPCNLE